MNRLYDWALLSMALLFAGLYVAAQQSARSAPTGIDRASVRALEDVAKVHDASGSYPEAVRTLIGLQDSRADTPAGVVSAVREELALRDGGPSLRLIAIAIAVAYEVDDTAKAALSSLDESAAAAPLAAQLRTLAGGAPLREPQLMEVGLQRLGASSWLQLRLRARHLLNAGDAEGARQVRSEALAAATVAVETQLLLLLFYLVMGVFGLLVLLTWPLTQRWLDKRGYLGLGPAPSPFDPDAAMRVMAGWFLCYLMTGWLVGNAVAAAGASARLTALGTAAQPLIHGTIAVWLIRHQSQRPPPRPIGVDMNLGVGMLPHRAVAATGLAIVMGGAVMLIASVAVQLNRLLVGPPQGQQTAIELIAVDGSAATIAVLVVGAVVLAPLFEEIIFRGFLYRIVRERSGRLAGALFSGAVFGAAHLDPGLFLPLTALGAGLAWTYEVSGSLAVPIAIHAAWNLLNLGGAYAIYQAS